MKGVSRHESITGEYLAELEAGFLEKAKLVKAAPDWAETQRLMVTGTYPYVLALRRVEEGWSHDQIACELERKLW